MAIVTHPTNPSFTGDLVFAGRTIRFTDGAAEVGVPYIAEAMARAGYPVADPPPTEDPVTASTEDPSPDVAPTDPADPDPALDGQEPPTDTPDDPPVRRPSRKEKNA